MSKEEYDGFYYEPTVYQMGGQEIRIEYTRKLEKDGKLGEFDPIEKLVRIQTHWADRELDEDALCVILYHEIFHSMLMHHNYFEHNADEQFVDQMGAAMQQIDKTLK